MPAQSVTYFVCAKAAAHAHDGSELSAARLPIAGSSRAAPAPSPSHSADATCRPREVSTAEKWKEGKRPGARAWQRLTPCACLSNSITGTGGEMRADERIKPTPRFRRPDAVNSADKRGVNGRCMACTARASSSPANRACSRPWSLSGASKTRSSAISARPPSAAGRCRWRRRGVADKVHVHAIARARRKAKAEPLSALAS